MRLTFLWSESAIAAAGDGFAAIEATLLEDVKDIAAHARSWFVHSSPPDGSFPTYLCDGEETEEGWTVTVRVARYEPAVPPAYMREPGVVSVSPVSSRVLRPERICGQPP